MSAQPYRCGYVAIIGRPNVGKSTLLNNLVGTKISITSRTAQTTRNRILAIKTTDECQWVYLDTPGIHGRREGKLINRIMNRYATSSLLGVDCALFVVTPKWREDDDTILELLKQNEVPVILVINKIDQLESKEQILPLIEKYSQKGFEFKDIVPVSALSGENLQRLEQVTARLLPQQPKLFSDTDVTDKSDRFMVSEFVREQIFRLLGDEVPHSIAVGIERFEKKGKMLFANAVVWVERDSQKAIVIGKKGEMIKTIGTRARKEIEEYLNMKAHLELWVKVRKNWRDDKDYLARAGFAEDQ